MSHLHPSSADTAQPYSATLQIKEGVSTLDRRASADIQRLQRDAMTWLREAERAGHVRPGAINPHLLMFEKSIRYKQERGLPLTSDEANHELYAHEDNAYPFS
ncbi:hypothetical protein HY285_00510 [Candidatus Peregrinibacteria bacterium]|nr:hypothetical protein [Candidatus Peregrinibacteria bacterium]MBI3816013.1 hypothetical protein [Candidatus Peregrinibacteria bacterium]